jgi:hypothetical protein
VNWIVLIVILIHKSKQHVKVDHQHHGHHLHRDEQALKARVVVANEYCDDPHHLISSSLCVTFHSPYMSRHYDPDPIVIHIHSSFISSYYLLLLTIV